MLTVWYLILWLTAGLGALIAGLVSHYAHAHFTGYPSQLFDGGGVSDTVLNEVLSPSYNPVGEYDDAGWWELYSLRNYLLHVAPWLFIVVATGIVNWPHQAAAISEVCEVVGIAGLTPVFCG